MADIISGKSRFTGNHNRDAEDNKVISFGENGKMNDADDLKEDLDEKDIKNKIRIHKVKMVIKAAIALVVIVLLAKVLLKVLDGITYSQYVVTGSVNRDDSETAKYMSYANGYIRYSNDGVAYFNKKGTAIWNHTISMQNPQIKKCGDAVAVGDINGSTICVFDKSGLLGTVDTSLAISQIEVAKHGVVAAVLEDNDANYINLYNVDGTQIYSVKTSLAGDGYPLDITISEDATKLMASFLYVSGETMKTNVVFYNFSDVGQNETERVVGGFNHYGSTIVGDVQFMNATTAVAVGEDIISIFSIKEYPKLVKEIPIESTIQRVFFSNSNVGLILDNSDSGDIYKLVIYNLSADKVGEATFNTQYNHIEFDGNSVLMSNSSNFALLNLSGKMLADIKTDLSLVQILPIGDRGKYILINSRYVQNIKLK